jgi:hypothetical protein
VFDLRGSKNRSGFAHRFAKHAFVQFFFHSNLFANFFAFNFYLQNNRHVVSLQRRHNRPTAHAQRRREAGELAAKRCSPILVNAQDRGVRSAKR